MPFHSEFYGWLCIATGAMGNVMLFAQGDKLPPTDWTAFGLLGTVLVSMGLFLRWYLPHREQAWEASSQQARADFLTALASQRESSEKQQAREAALLERINQDLSKRLELVSGEVRQQVHIELANFRTTLFESDESNNRSRPPAQRPTPPST